MGIDGREVRLFDQGGFGDEFRLGVEVFEEHGFNPRRDTKGTKN